jgi:hypothetical protein
MRGLWIAVAGAALIALSGIAASGPSWAQSRGSDSASHNVRESEQYERLVCSNPAFRAKRIKQECGPITDPQLHQSCVASFQCGAAAPTGRNWRQAPSSETMR